MTVVKRALIFFGVVLAAVVGVPGPAGASVACSSIIFNACFYPEPAFRGSEYQTLIYSPGCFGLPPSRSYHTDVPVTVYSEPDCTGESAEISGFFGFDIGFSARSYLK